jgi:hypothetical protein
LHEGIGGTWYWEHPDHSRTYIREDWLGNLVEHHPDGRKTYIRRNIFGRPTKKHY